MINKIFGLLILIASIGYNQSRLDYNTIEQLISPEITISIVLEILRKIIYLWKYDPNSLGLDPYEETKKIGYPVENHIVQTEDGYLLTVLRIPYGKNEKEVKTNRPVVYLQPGLFCSAACFTNMGSKDALAYLLADAGYDVWISHPRGTTFSRSHTIYNSMESKKYWNFSWHEIGTIDIPNTIDYILAETNQKQVNYIGHSQGTTTLFVMLSEKPKYNEKIKVGIALAPIAFMENHPSNSILTNLADKYDLISIIFAMKRVYDIFPHSEAFSDPIMKKCNYNSNDEDLAECTKSIDFFVGYSQDQIDPRNLELIVSHFPSGASTKQLEHYAQLINNGGFTKFDYGKKLNEEIYGQEFAPSYNLKNIEADMYLIYGDNDTIGTTKDTYNLHNKLSNSKIFPVDYSPFSHFDFLCAKVAPNVLYKRILEILLEYNPNSNPNLISSNEDINLDGLVNIRYEIPFY